MLGELLFMVLVTQQLYDEPESCKIQYSGPVDEWRFLKVYEQSTGEVVLQTVIKGGDSKSVFVKTPRIVITSKWAGDKNYRSHPVTSCAGGNTIRM